MSKQIDLKVKLLNEYAFVPKYSREGDAALGLFLPRGHSSIQLLPGEEVVVKLGVAIAIPPGHVGKIFSRSGQGFKFNTRLTNTTGIIDSNYRGELVVKLIRDITNQDVITATGGRNHLGPRDPLTITAGQEVAQLIIEEIPHVNTVVVDDLDETNRGVAGFGSSDALNENIQ